MKKTVLSVAALLLGFLAYSQEADNLGRHAEVSVIPRLDLNPGYGSESSELGFDLGNSSLYTLFEGSLSEHFSWTVANHWLQYDSEDCLWPYKSMGRSDSTNWLDYFKADFSFSGWTFTLGKDMISTGGFEYDDWDWDIYPLFSTPFAANFCCYQWGGKLAWTTPSEMSTFSAQMTASPYGEQPFASGLWTYSAMWRGEYGPLSNIWSVSAVEREPKTYDYIFYLGQRVSFEDFTLTVDWSNNYGSDNTYILVGSEDDSGAVFVPGKGNTVAATLAYSFSDALNIAAKGSYVASHDRDLYGDHWTAGCILEYFPLADSQDLRLHALLAYNSELALTSLSIGARWNFVISLF